MQYKITIDLEGNWVLNHQEDDVLPIDAISAHLSNLYPSIKVVDQSYVSIVITIDSDLSQAKSVQETIENFFLVSYEVKSNDEVLTVAIEEITEQKDTDNDLNKTGTSALGSLLKSFKDRSSSLDDDEIAPKEEKPSSIEPEGNAILNKINDYVGATELKALCKEIVTIAPEIKKNSNYDTFLSRNYLFSINSGYGLSTALKALQSVIEACGLAKFTKNKKIIETTAEKVEDRLECLDHGEYRIVSVDISEKMSSLNDPDFKKLLHTIACYSDRAIFVFVIPFVDKEVLKKTIYTLNDVLFIKDVSFSPLTKKEMETFALKQIKERGFTISKGALEYFHARIAEEKSDGRFYGLKTITKVVNELIYTKQLSNATSTKPTTVIRKKDATGLCKSTMSDLSGYELLAKLVASDKLKEKIDEIISQILLSKQDASLESPCIHMQFIGNPGTGKTTVARIIGKILREKGVLRVGGFHEFAGRDLCGRYIGETAPKTASLCRDAYGSVLFIDEAYSLYRTEDAGRDYGREALDTLIAEMENHRTDLVVILAGYKDEMALLMKGNAGLSSRIPYKIEFPNFTREQLFDIFVNMVKDNFKYETDLFDAAKSYFNELSEDFITSKEFSNARYVRNLFERTWAKASMRCQLAGQNTVTLTRTDFETATMDNDFKKTEPKRRKIGFN